MTIQAAKLWCMQRFTAEEQRRRLPSEITRMMIVSLICGAFFLYCLLSPHHLGDNNGASNWFGVAIFAASFLLSLAVYVVLLMKSRQQ